MLSSALRRTLQQTAVTTAKGSFAAASSLSSSVAAVPDGAPPARIAVVGCGWWSQGWHLPHLERNPGAAIAGLCDPSTRLSSSMNPDMQQLPELGETYGVPTFSSLEDLLAAGVEVDGVLVGSSHASHYAICKTALQAGLHVFCEKPMTTSVEEATNLVDLVRTAGDRHFMVNNTANWRDNAVHAAGIVAAGRVGEVRHASCLMASPLLWLFDDPANESWTQPARQNGFGWGQLSHTLAWILRVTGLTPTQVYCAMGWSEKSGADLYDSAILTCDNGATIVVQGVATIPGKNPYASKIIENRIYGTEGCLSYCGDDLDVDSGALELRRHDGANETHAGFLFENYESEGMGPESLLSFVESCRSNNASTPLEWNGCDVNVGALTVATIDAMYRSANAGTVVELVR